MEPAQLRLVTDDEVCTHQHTSGGTTWACARKPHTDKGHHMVPVGNRTA